MGEDPKKTNEPTADPQKDADQTNPQPNNQPPSNPVDVEALKKEIEELKKQASKSVDSEIVKTLLDKVDTLAKTIESIKQQEEERRKKEEEEYLKNLPEIERLKHQLEKKDEEIERIKKEIEESLGKRTQELEAKLKAYEEERARLAQAAAKARALEVATRLGAYNPEQVYKMIDDALVTGEDGEIYARVPDGQGGYKQIPIDEYLKDFLNRPENKNLLKTNAAVGEGKPPKEEGSTPTSKGGDEGTTPFEKLPKEEQDKYALEAALKGMEPEVYYNIQMAKKRHAKKWRERHMKKK